MYIKKVVYTFLICFYSFSALFAQKGSKNKKNNTYSLSSSFDWGFKNAYRITYYSDEDQLKKIKKLDKNKDWKNLYPLLKSYVSQFGIENFQRDSYWLWRLAKLTELFGSLEEAKLLYRLVLKHTVSSAFDLKKVELYYDSLSQQDKDYYVPIQYYYELVEYRKAIDTLRPPKGVLVNMGENINSLHPDYGPAMGSRKDIIYFTSKRTKIKENGRVVDNEDIFVSKNYDGYWDEAELVKEVDTRYNEGSPWITKDGKSLFFSRCKSPDSYGDCDLFMVSMQSDGTWGGAQNLGPGVNSIAWDSHPSLSHDEDTLFFASDRIGGFGLADIYFSVKGKNGVWGNAQNLGPVINTKDNEVSPFYHPWYHVLYFSSNGQLVNFGDYDIYKSTFVQGQWSEPKNIGPLVNGSGSEYYFAIEHDSKRLFYARSEANDKTNLDMYSFPLPMEAQPHAHTKFKGTVLDSASGKPLHGIVSIIDLDYGIEVSPKFIRPDGSFEFDLIDKTNYLLVVQSDTFFRIEEIIFLNGDAQVAKKANTIPSKIQFRPIEFEEGEAEILESMKFDLNKIVDFLVDNPDFKLRISGHTDSRGNAEQNMKLSQRRAEAIKDYIIRIAHISKHRIQAIGCGSTKPIVKEQTDDDRRLNRRVEFEIYKKINQ